MKDPHPAVHAISHDANDAPYSDRDRNHFGLEHTTSPSLARALAIGCLSRLDPGVSEVSIWDPTAGSGYAGAMLVDALESAGVRVRYRGQDINDRVVIASRERFASFADAEIAQADTLVEDPFADFSADLVIVDAPWGLSWRSSAPAVRTRHEAGEFGFGLPQSSDSTWLFISLALEKLRPAADGGGRVAALVAPSALSSGDNTAEMRRAIVDAGMLESVTRLPEGLAPNTAIPLYLLTFTNQASRTSQNTVMIADLQAQFTTEGRNRSISPAAFAELEAGLRTGKPSARNRSIRASQLTRRDVPLVRMTGEGRRLSWRLTTFNDTLVDSKLLESRYGPDGGVSVDGVGRETVDLDPGRYFDDDSREILKDLAAKGWPTQRLTNLLAAEPEPLKGNEDSSEADLFVPTTRTGVVSTVVSGTASDGRVLSIRLDGDPIHTGFLAAWLNSEQGLISQRRAIDAGSTGAHLRAVRSDPGSLMRWADELIIPVPPSDVQLAVASADERLASFQAELSTRRASIWASPEGADAVVSGVAGAFDDSLSSWLEQLPYPIATALWTAETASSVGDKQLAYMHAWEAIVAFHATVLLSAIRSIPGRGTEVQAAIRRALHEQRLGIERAAFGTWIVIAEKTSSVIRQALDSADRDEIARIRRAFGDLGQAGIARLASKDAIRKFKELNTKRNRWNGHSGYTADEQRQVQIDALVADLREIRQIFGDVWAQLTLVRAGSVERGRDGYVQSAEVALGTKSPFRKSSYRVGDPMVSGDLYLVKDGSESPLRLLQFVQLRPAPHDAQYTTYFYNRTEGSNVRLVSYQHGSESELQEAAASFRDDFGELTEQ